MNETKNIHQFLIFDQIIAGDFIYLGEKTLFSSAFLVILIENHVFSCSAVEKTRRKWTCIPSFGTVCFLKKWWPLEMPRR